MGKKIDIKITERKARSNIKQRFGYLKLEDDRWIYTASFTCTEYPACEENATDEEISFAQTQGKEKYYKWYDIHPKVTTALSAFYSASGEDKWIINIEPHGEDHLSVYFDDERTMREVLDQLIEYFFSH